MICSLPIAVLAQQNMLAAGAKKISPDLFGVFFEDLSYAADGGLYGELVQNRSFEYSPNDRKGWHSFTAWEYVTEGYGYGNITVETAAPVHANNPHYIVLNIEEEGQKGIGLKNTGYDGIVVKGGEQYDFSVFMKGLSAKPVTVQVQLQSRRGQVYGEAAFRVDAAGWKKYSAAITAAQSDDSACLVIRATTKGRLAMDMISLFPEKTFRDRPNGLRADLAGAIADLHPKFVRFPGGCLVHGDGLGNMYQWKATIGPVEQRTEQRNIWNYHQTVGLGYFEYFQFCEDIGAKPLPVLAAGVSCQNSGGTWRIGGTGQRGIPMEDMKAYIQDILDLIEYANGPATSAWGSKRAAAGHPAPFNLQYLGIGNEDKQTDNFRERFTVIYNAVRQKHPEITIVGTVGPSPAGPDYEQGWQLANRLAIPVVDEHYYERAEWFLQNNFRYDQYDRSRSKVYVGEYASKGNTLADALAEAAYMTGLERNGDIVQLASYAPLLAKLGNTSWNPDLIYFNNTAVFPSVNYYVQQLFSVNAGDNYYPGVISFPDKEVKNGALAASCVRDSRTGDIILKIVNAGADNAQAKVNLSGFKWPHPKAVCTTLTGDPKSRNTIDHPDLTIPQTSSFTASGSFMYPAVANSLTVIRIKTIGQTKKRAKDRKN